MYKSTLIFMANNLPEGKKIMFQYDKGCHMTFPYAVVHFESLNEHKEYLDQYVNLAVLSKEDGKLFADHVTVFQDNTEWYDDERAELSLQQAAYFLQYYLDEGIHPRVEM